MYATEDVIEQICTQENMERIHKTEKKKNKKKKQKLSNAHTTEGSFVKNALTSREENHTKVKKKKVR